MPVQGGYMAVQGSCKLRGQHARDALHPSRKSLLKIFTLSCCLKLVLALQRWFRRQRRLKFVPMNHHKCERKGMGMMMSASQ